MYRKRMRLKLKWYGTNEAKMKLKKGAENEVFLGYNVKIVILVRTFGREE